jgi:hypothetical protein
MSQASDCEALQAVFATGGGLIADWLRQGVQ